MRGDEKGFNIFLGDADRINRRKLIDYFAYSRGVAELVAFNDVGGDLFSIGSKKIEPRFMPLSSAVTPSGSVSALRLLDNITTKGNPETTLPISKSTGKPFCSSSMRSMNENGDAWILPPSRAWARAGLLPTPYSIL